MTTAAPTDTANAARRASRLARQARVGILHNPADPPKPPPRRAPLMGRWPSLRSGRRPTAQRLEGAVQSVVASLGDAADDGAGGRTVDESVPRTAVQQGVDGRVTGIDIAALMAAANGITAGTADSAPIRTPFAASMRSDRAPESPLSGTRKPRVLTADAWLDFAPEAQGDPAPGMETHPTTPARPRRARAARIVALGVTLSLATLVAISVRAAL